MIQARFDLFVVELQEEKLRVISLLIWLGVAVALGMVGLLLAIGTLALFLWERAGYAGLIGLTVVTLGAAGLVLAVLRRRLLRGPAPFAATTTEIRKDIASLKMPE